MKSLLLLSLLALDGCQSAPPRPEPPVVLPAKEPASPPRDEKLALQLSRQTQLAEALLSQNEALQAKLFLAAEGKPVAAAADTSSVPPRQASAVEEKGEAAVAPNADGVIDLTAPAAGAETDANPFAVRKAAPDSVREVVLQVAGLVGGTRSCAVINDRLVEPGGSIEGFTLVRIEAAAVILQFERWRLRLPLADKPVRVRLTT